MAPSTTPALQRRDALIRRFLPLADALARRQHHRWRHLLERDDLTQVARLSLVHAAGRIRDEATAPAYLKRCITGALSHHLRDRSRLVRLPAKAQHLGHWQHLSLDADQAGSCLLDQLPAPQPTAPSVPSLLVPQLLALLQPRQAAAVQLTVLDGLSLRQAAKALGVSAMTVSRDRQQGLDQLQRALRPAPALAS